MKPNHLRKIRIQKGMSQEYVAHQLGITQKSYSNLENGKVCANSGKIREVSKVLDVSPNEICSNACSCKLNDDLLSKILSYMINNQLEIPDFLIDKLKLTELR